MLVTVAAESLLKMAQLKSEQMAEGVTFPPDLDIKDGYVLVTETDITDIVYVAPTENQASVAMAKV